jgi:hypothetical protein
MTEVYSGLGPDTGDLFLNSLRGLEGLFDRSMDVPQDEATSGVPVSSAAESMTSDNMLNIPMNSLQRAFEFASARASAEPSAFSNQVVTMVGELERLVEEKVKGSMLPGKFGMKSVLSAIQAPGEGESHSHHSDAVSPSTSNGSDSGSEPRGGSRTPVPRPPSVDSPTGPSDTLGGSGHGLSDYSGFLSVHGTVKNEFYNDILSLEYGLTQWTPWSRGPGTNHESVMAQSRQKSRHARERTLSEEEELPHCPLSVSTAQSKETPPSEQSSVPSGGL